MEKTPTSAERIVNGQQGFSKSEKISLSKIWKIMDKKIRLSFQLKVRGQFLQHFCAKHKCREWHKRDNSILPIKLCITLQVHTTRIYTQVFIMYVLCPMTTKQCPAGTKTGDKTLVKLTLGLFFWSYLRIKVYSKLFVLFAT